ncbi:MAG: ribonuclease E/G, partial [Desulfurobacterium sp.]
MERQRLSERSSLRTNKQILINVHTKEVRIAVLEDGELVEFYVERKGNRGIVGNIYKGRVQKIVPAVQAAFVDIGVTKKAFLYVRDAVAFEFEEDDPFEGTGGFENELPSIEEVLSEGQEVIVQVSKEPIGTKGPRVTTNVTVPGHYLVLLPTVNRVGISRRITDEGERERLRAIASEIKPKEYGIIVRTAAEGAEKEELQRDLDY